MTPLWTSQFWVPMLLQMNHLSLPLTALVMIPLLTTTLMVKQQASKKGITMLISASTILMDSRATTLEKFLCCQILLSPSTLLPIEKLAGSTGPTTATGLPGSLNDINVFNRSPLFSRLWNGDSPQVEFDIFDHHYTQGYYLADGIYPSYATL